MSPRRQHPTPNRYLPIGRSRTYHEFAVAAAVVMVGVAVFVDWWMVSSVGMTAGEVVAVVNAAGVEVFADIH